MIKIIDNKFINKGVNIDINNKSNKMLNNILY